MALSKSNASRPVTVYYADGSAQSTHENYRDALKALELEFFGVVIGHDGDLTDGGDRTFVWKTFEDAEFDEAGEHAIATIRYETR